MALNYFVFGLALVELSRSVLAWFRYRPRSDTAAFRYGSDFDRGLGQGTCGATHKFLVALNKKSNSAQHKIDEVDQ